MIDWDNLLVSQDVTSALDTFLDKINILLDKHAPVEPVSNRYLKQHRKPWVDKDLLKLFKERDKMYKKFQKEKDDTVKKVLFDNFKVKRNEVIKLSRQKKDQYYQQLFQDNKNNLLKLWKFVKSLITMKRANKKEINCLNVNGTDISNPKIIANHLNIFFTKIASDIDKKNCEY